MLIGVSLFEPRDRGRTILVARIARPRAMLRSGLPGPFAGRHRALIAFANRPCIYRLLINFGCDSISGTVRGGYPSLLFIILWMQDGNTFDKFTYIEETETED